MRSPPVQIRAALPAFAALLAAVAVAVAFSDSMDAASGPRSLVLEVGNGHVSNMEREGSGPQPSRLFQAVTSSDPVGLFQPPIAPSGQTLTRFSGGSVATLISALAASGAASATATLPNGETTTVVATALVFVNEDFNAAFPGGVPSDTVLWVRAARVGAAPGTLQFDADCASAQVGTLQLEYDCFLNVHAGGGTVESIVWTVTYTPQPGVEYDGEVVEFVGLLRRTFTLDQTYQSTISIEVEVCTSVECSSALAYFDG